MLLFIVMTSIIVIGLLAIALAHPPRVDLVVWNDELERQLLRERQNSVGWW
jgi:hypothetical protein